MHPCPGNWVEIGRVVVYYARAAHTFSAGIKCRMSIGQRGQGGQISFICPRSVLKALRPTNLGGPYGAIYRQLTVLLSAVTTLRGKTLQLKKRKGHTKMKLKMKRIYGCDITIFGRII